MKKNLSWRIKKKDWKGKLWVKTESQGWCWRLWSIIWFESDSRKGRALLQGILPTQELNLCLLHCRQVLYPVSHHWFWSLSTQHTHTHTYTQCDGCCFSFLFFFFFCNLAVDLRVVLSLYGTKGIEEQVSLCNLQVSQSPKDRDVLRHPWYGQ